MAISTNEGGALGRLTRRFRRTSQPAAPTPISAETLAAAIERHELQLHFQPLLSAASGHTVAIEALLRWEQPAGTLAARQFFARAQAGGLLPRIDRELLVQACRFARELQRSGYDGLRLAVNVSVDELLPGSGGIGWIRQALQDSGLRPQWLDIEINERETVGREQELAPVFSALTSIGLNITLDDYWAVRGEDGAIMLPGVSAVKVDLWSNTGSELARRDLTTAVEVARERGLQVYAKRVETIFEEQFAAELGCDALQGFALGLPVGAAELRRTLAPAAALQPAGF
ncbi:MAG: EAL domain-containing protein [Dehalococcoidia bacterium]